MGRFSKSIRQAGLALVVVGAAITLGCTREAKDTSSVRLSFSSSAYQKDGALALDTNVIIINVSYPGMTRPIYYEWDRHSNCTAAGACASPPEFISLDVPKGPDRLIQVLLVKEDDATGQMVFKYKDALKNLQNASEDVTITPEVIGSAGMQAHISGRYMDSSAGGGPTGMVVGKFDPGLGKPLMTVIHSFMFAGWFSNLMAMDGDSKFSYFLNDQPLPQFTNLNINSTSLAGSSRVVRLNIPQRDRQNYSGGGATWKTEAAEKIILGYFGPNAGSNKACYDQRTNIDITDLRLPGSSTVMKWGGASPSANQVGVEAGGGGVAYDPSTNDSEPCEISGTEFTSHMDFKYSQLRNGHDSVTGFRSIFRGAMNNGSLEYATKTHNAGAQTLTVNFSFLPGVTTGPSRIQGITAYRRVSAGGSSHEDLYGGGFDGIDCNRLSSLGFTAVGADYVVSSEATTGSMVLNGFSTLTDTQLVLCPFLEAGSAGKFYPPGGLEVWLDSGGSMGNQPATSVVAIAPNLAGDYRWANNTCVPIKIEGRNGANPGDIPVGTNLTFSTSGSNTAFYSDNCSTSISGSIPISGPGLTIWMNIANSNPTAATANLYLGVSGAGLTFTVPPIAYYYLNAPGTYTDLIKVNVPPSILAYSCVNTSLEAWRDDGSNPPVFAQPSSLHPNLASLANLQFYYMTGGPCSSPASSSISFSGGAVQDISFIYSGASASINIQPTYAGITVSGGAAVSVTQPGAASKVKIEMNDNIEEGKCVPMRFSFSDANGNVAPSTAGSNVEINTSSPAGSGFWLNPSCNSSGPIEISPGQTGVNAYFLATSQGGGNLSATADNGLVSPNMPLTITPPKAQHILYAIEAGQNFTPGSGISGTINTITESSPFFVNMYAVTYNNQIDTSFNATSTYFAIHGGSGSCNSGVVLSPVTFVSGVAMAVNIMPTCNSGGAFDAYLVTDWAPNLYMSNPNNFSGTFRIYP